MIKHTKRKIIHKLIKNIQKDKATEHNSQEKQREYTDKETTDRETDNRQRKR